MVAAATGVTAVVAVQPRPVAFAAPVAVPCMMSFSCACHWLLLLLLSSTGKGMRATGQPRVSLFLCSFTALGVTVFSPHVFFPSSFRSVGGVVSVPLQFLHHYSDSFPFIADALDPSLQQVESCMDLLFPLLSVQTSRFPPFDPVNAVVL